MLVRTDMDVDTAVEATIANTIVFDRTQRIQICFKGKSGIWHCSIFDVYAR